MMFFYQLFYHLYFWLKRLKRSGKTGVFKRPITYLCDQYSYYFWVLLNRKYTKFFLKRPVKWGLNQKKRPERYTVSLTSFPARIEYAWIAIETLMRQRFKPDQIILWLASSQFPDEKIPESLERLKEKGLTVRFCDDLRSHKKYYYVFQEYPDDHIVIVDDDMFYPLDMISKLVRLHKRYPQDIVCTSAQIIAPAITSSPTEWIPTQNTGDYCHKIRVQAFSGAGSLFPCHWYSQELFDLEKIKKLAWTADDLWLKTISIINHVKTTKIKKFRAFNVEIDIPHNQTLFSVNKGSGDNLNNITWEGLCREYHLKTYDEER